MDGTVMNGLKNGEVNEERGLFIETATVKPDSRDTDDSEDMSGFCTIFKTQPIYRERFMHTVWICLAFIMLGWIEGLFGPTFPDLQLIINQSLDTSSWLFTATSGGFLVGSLATGFLFDRCNTILVLAWSIIGTAVTIVVLPWCPYFSLMLVVRFLTGTLAAGLDTGGNAEVITIWGHESGRYMQALHFCFSLGGMISPLVAQPFLATKECLAPSLELNRTVLNGYTISREDMVSAYPTVAASVETDVTLAVDNDKDNFHTMYGNRSHYISVGFDELGNTTESVVANSTECVQGFGTTRVHYAYLISAVLLLVTCIPFVAFLIMHIREKRRRKVVPVERTDENVFSQLTMYQKVLILFLLASLMFVYVGIEDMYAGFLMTFTIMHMGWSKANGSYATSLYWICFGVGRFSGIFLVNIVKSVTLLWIFSIMLVISFTGILIAALIDIPVLLWICIGMSGLSMSVIFPSVFIWTTESITPVSGKISALFMVSSSMSVMLNPIMFGYTMERYSPLWFIYLLLSQSVLWVVLYSITLVLTKCLLHRKKTVEGKDPEREMLNVND